MKDEVREVFNYFVSKKDDKISITQVGVCLRALGYTPTEEQIARLTKPWGEDGRVSLEEFVPIVNNMEQEKKKGKHYTENDYVEAFHQIDRDGEGSIPSSIVRHMLSSMGERLSQDEINRTLFGLEDSDGRVNIVKFVDRICDINAEF